MSDESPKDMPECLDPEHRKIVLMGNPNVGKSVVFSRLTISSAIKTASAVIDPWPISAEGFSIVIVPSESILTHTVIFEPLFFDPSESSFAEAQFPFIKHTSKYLRAGVCVLRLRMDLMPRKNYSKIIRHSCGFY